MKHLAKNLVVVTCLLALGAFSTWIVLRPRLPRGDGFTDGEQFLAATRTREELRLARWEPPVPLAGIVEGSYGSDPFLEPATGRLFFVKGDAGAEDLWLATPEGDGYVVRPITELNSPRRETAPAFADGWLYFASDRSGGQGGLDLWRAPISGDRFLAPENLGATVNSSADETDPALRDPPSTVLSDPDESRASNELWFASNREIRETGDFDLLFAKVDGDGLRFGVPELATSVQTPWDERAPAFSPDGRLLLFASNRTGGAGGFDLWRALARETDFNAPANLGTPNGRGDELGPTLGDDGFTLLFACDVHEPTTGQLQLARTRTRELFPVEAPRFTLSDFTVLLLLAIVALMAWLARRWEALDVLYKCMVVSLLVHLMILWGSRRVDVEASAANFGPSSDTFEIHVIGDVLDTVARMEDRAWGESVGDPDGGGGDFASAPERTSLMASLAEVDVAPSGSYVVERDVEAGESAAPAASERTLGRSGTPSPAGGDPVRELGETFERMGGAAPDVRIVAAAGAGRAGGGAGDVVIAADASFAPLASAAALGAQGSGADGGAPREAAGSGVERAGGGSGDGGDGEEGSAGGAGAPSAVAREHLPSTRARGGREGPMVTTAKPSDRVASATPRGSGGEGDGPATLVLAPNARAGSGSGAGSLDGDGRGSGGSGDGSGSGGNAGGTGRGPKRAGLSELPSGGPIGDPGPRRESPLAGGTSGRGGGSGTGDGNAGDGSGAGPLARGPSGPLGPGAPSSRGPLPAVALASPGDGLGSGFGDGTGNGDGSGSGASRADGSGTEGSGRGTGRGTSPAPGLALVPSSNLGSGGSGTGLGMSAVVARGPARASLLGNGSGTGSGGGLGGNGGSSPGGEPGPAPFAPLDLPIGLERGSPEGVPGGGSGPPGVSRLYERRFGEQKDVAVREGGGSAETERAVLAGLRYLAKVQRSKGFFGDASDVDPDSKYRDFRVGKTGLALLAFLGAGHTHRSATEFSENVTRALAWIVSRQDQETGHFGNSESYSHGIATYALAECYAITKDAELRAPLERALEHLLAMQTLGTGDPQKDGGWTYYYKEGPGFDEYPRASISSWQVMALESAKVGGIEVPEESLAAARTYFLKSFDPNFGGFRYTHNPSWVKGSYGTLPASTPASMFALTLLGEKDHARVAAAEEYVLERLPKGYRFRGEDAFVRRGQANVYFWYYSTLALFCRGGSAWREWNDSLKQTLLPAQQQDGSWEAIDVYSQRYAYDDREDRAYTTSMCVLMLEVYYRYFTPLLGKLDAQ